jgi:hypothetical protein
MSPFSFSFVGKFRRMYRDLIPGATPPEVVASM